MALCYDDDPDYPVQQYDDVTVTAGEFRFPAMVKKVLPRKCMVLVSFGGIDPVLDLIVLRKSATVPLTALEFVGRGM